MRVLTTGQCRNSMPSNLADDITDLHICVDDGGADRAGSCQVNSTTALSVCDCMTIMIVTGSFHFFKSGKMNIFNLLKSLKMHFGG